MVSAATELVSVRCEILTTAGGGMRATPGANTVRGPSRKHRRRLFKYRFATCVNGVKGEKNSYELSA